MKIIGVAMFFLTLYRMLVFTHMHAHKAAHDGGGEKHIRR
jgi:hypothetical protein